MGSKVRGSMYGEGGGWSVEGITKVNRLCSVESIAVLILLCAASSVLYIHKTLKQKNFSSHRPTLYLIFPHTLSVLPVNSFKPLSKRFSFPSFLSSHPHTQFPSATSILNTTDTFCCFQIVVVRPPSSSISLSTLVPNVGLLLKTSPVQRTFQQNFYCLNYHNL